MALIDHPSFVWPEDTTAKLWRYMDLDKFLWFLDESALFFSRAHLLGDPFEGSTPMQNIRDLRNLECHIQFSHQEALTSHFASTKRAFLPYYLVNCWHMNEFESAAMWRLYSNSIALQTRFDRLVRILPEDMGIGRVAYIDYMTDRIPEGNSYNQIMHKRKSFEHEREIRAVVMDDKLDATTLQRLYESTFEERMSYINALDKGIRVPVNSLELIESIRVSPTAPELFVGVVQNIVKRYGYNFPVERSDLDRDPIY